MTFIGIDLHTNRFTCRYRTERLPAEEPKDRVMKTFDLTAEGLAAFYATVDENTYVLVEATITTRATAFTFRKK